MKLVSFTEFAKLVEVSRQAISRAAKPKGVLATAVVKEKGRKKLRFEDAAHLWRTRNTNMIRGGREPMTEEEEVANGLPPTSESRQREAFFKAEKLEMETRQRKGELVDIKVVKAHSLHCGNALRQATNSFGKRNAHEAVAIDNLKEMALFLDERANEILTAFCENLEKAL